MRLPLLPAIILVIISLAVDGTIYAIARRRFRSKWPRRVHVGVCAILYAMVIVALCLPRKSGDDSTLLAVMWILFTYLSVLVSKLVFLLIYGISLLPKLFRRRPWSPVALGAPIGGLVVFVLFWWGALVNRFNIQVRDVSVDVESLPVSFDGYRIAQISDLHTGTYGTDTTFLSGLVERVNELRPDLIVFTGDIVNRHSAELKPFVGTLSRLRASDGVVSILGNHDYGDYASWPSDDVKAADIDSLVAMQGRMGWRLLRNETHYITRQCDTLAVIGVENIGDPPFPSYGSLTDAYPSLADSLPKILLSHNPAHWSMEIASRPAVNVGLTLAGHTHAMQMELFGVSPAALRYATWGGLYYDAEGRHPLYVNIGIGAVGLPTRIGATPEITLITLRSPVTK